MCVGSSDQWLCVARLPPSLTEEAFLNLASNYGKVCECQPLSTIIVILIVILILTNFNDFKTIGQNNFVHQHIATNDNLFQKVFLNPIDV